MDDQSVSHKLLSYSSTFSLNRAQFKLKPLAAQRHLYHFMELMTFPFSSRGKSTRQQQRNNNTTTNIKDVSQDIEPSVLPCISARTPSIFDRGQTSESSSCSSNSTYSKISDSSQSFCVSNDVSSTAGNYAYKDDRLTPSLSLADDSTLAADEHDISSRRHCSGHQFNIPSDIFLEILKFLDFRDLLSCGLVCHEWNSMINTSWLWCQAYLANGWKAKPYLADNLSINWKYLFKARQLLENNWRAGNVEAKALPGHSDSVYCVTIDKSRRIITGSRDNTIKVWSIDTGQLLHTLSQETSKVFHTGSVLCLQSDSKILVSGSSDCSCIIWDASRFRPIRKVFRHVAGVLSVGVADDYIVSCSKDGSICVSNRDSNYSEKYRIVDSGGAINSIRLHGNYIFSVAGDALVKMWDLESGQRLRTFHGHSRSLAVVEVSDCGKYVLSAGNDHTIRIWHLETGTCAAVLQSHKALIRSLRVFGNKIISGSYDRTIQVWDLYTQEKLTTLKGFHGGWIFSATADASKIVSTSFGKNPIVLDFSGGLDPNMLALIDC